VVADEAAELDIDSGKKLQLVVGAGRWRLIGRGLRRCRAGWSSGSS
jgi:hypothetical protein